MDAKQATLGGAVLLGLLTLAAADGGEPGAPMARRVSDVALPVDAEALDRQHVALLSMPSVKVAYSRRGPVEFMEGSTGIVLSSATRNLRDGEQAPEVVQKLKDVLLATGSETLEVRWNEMSTQLQLRSMRFEQSINGIPVLYGGIKLTLDEATGMVVVLGATFLPDRGLPRQPQISQEDAATRAVRFLEREAARPGSVKTSTPTLAYWGTHPESTRAQLIWAVPTSYSPTSERDSGGSTIWIDAVDGTYAGEDPLVVG